MRRSGRGGWRASPSWASTGVPTSPPWSCRPAGSAASSPGACRRRRRRSSLLAWRWSGRSANSGRGRSFPMATTSAWWRPWPSAWACTPGRSWGRRRTRCARCWWTARCCPSTSACRALGRSPRPPRRPSGNAPRSFPCSRSRDAPPQQRAPPARPLPPHTPGATGRRGVHAHVHVRPSCGPLGGRLVPVPIDSLQELESRA
mmetsp:Transcript_643/g.2265  ORF Transcript_643/g.2265 Transcript_643/m.2265 type:complete len:202 (+) Transcript_643:1098-1703(+)